MAGRGLTSACSRRPQGRANPALRLPQSNWTAAGRLTQPVRDLETGAHMLSVLWGKSMKQLGLGAYVQYPTD